MSNYMCRRAHYWIGTKQEFYLRCHSVALGPLLPEAVSRQIEVDQQEIVRRELHLQRAGAAYISVYYEDLFDAATPPGAKLGIVNSILEFLGLSQLREEELPRSWYQTLDPRLRLWSSPALYRRIVNIDQIERRCGRSETGWLFK